MPISPIPSSFRTPLWIQESDNRDRAASSASVLPWSGTLPESLELGREDERIAILSFHYQIDPDSLFDDSPKTRLSRSDSSENSFFHQQANMPIDGHRSLSNPRSHFRQSDVFVHPYRMENQPLRLVFYLVIYYLITPHVHSPYERSFCRILHGSSGKKEASLHPKASLPDTLWTESHFIRIRREEVMMSRRER